MPEVNVQIGGRDFLVHCEAGEEPHLQAAAKLLDTEAATLQSQIGRVPESRMLLMAGLMLADRFKEIDFTVRSAEERIRSLESQLRAAEARAASLAASAPKAFPQDTAALLEAYKGAVSKLEALAEQLEAK